MRPTGCSLAAALCERRAVSGGCWEEVVAASEYRALQQQVREFQAAARKKTLENEIPAPSADLVQKTTVARFTKSVGPAEGGR